MSSPPAAEDVWRDARWLAQALDPNAGLLRVVEMTAAAYREASFLDDRYLQQPRNAHLLNWQEVAAARPEQARSDARWIFHIGHAGSTLVARMLGELGGVLAVREPRALRDLTFFPVEIRSPLVPTLRALMSRAFAAEQIALVKATSLVSEIAAELVPPGGRALMMYAGARNHVANILAGQNSRKETAMLADSRRTRMDGRVTGLDEWRTSEAHLAAAAWACEMTSLEQAAERMTDRRLHWLDFDAMLGSVEGSLSDVAAFFGFAALPARIREVADGPLLRRYSKALDHEYSPAVRLMLREQAGRDFGADIDSALAMLSRAAETSPLLARALARAEE